MMSHLSEQSGAPAGRVQGKKDVVRQGEGCGCDNRPPAFHRLLALYNHYQHPDSH